MKKLILPVLLALIFIHFTYQNDGPNIWTQSLSNAGQIWGLAVAPSNPQIIYAASNSQGIWKSTNAGANWTQMNTGLSNLILQCVAVSAANPNIVMCGTTNTGSNPGVYRSTDGAASWTRVVTGIVETNINIQGMAIDPVNPNTAYITLFDGTTNQTNGIYKTTDGGASWVPITNGIGTIKNFLSVAINPLNANVVYAGTSFDPISAMGPAKIYKSVNGGALWTDVSSGLPNLTTDVKPVRCISISRSDTAVVLAGLFVNTDSLGGGMYVSTNGGGLWTRRMSGLPGAIGTLPRSCLIRPGSSNEFFVGLGNATNTGIGVFRTTNRGLNWTDFNGGLMLNTYTVRALDFKTTADSTLFLGAAHPTLPTGQGVFEYSWPPLGINDPNILPDKFVLEQNYPNPFNPETIIKYSIPFASFVTIKIYNASGKEVSTIVNSQRSPGNYEVTFSSVGLPSGAYFYKLTAGDFTETKKMILLK